MKPRNQLTLIVTAGVLGVIAVAAGCGGSKSTASRSAAEYDAARAKGEPVKTEEGHGGHSAGQASVAETASPGAPMDHARMGHTTPTSPGTRPGQGSGMPGMDHSTTGKRGNEHAGMDHSSMPMPSTQRRASGRGAAMDPGRMPGMAPGAAAGTQHGSSAMDHSRMAEGGSARYRADGGHDSWAHHKRGQHARNAARHHDLSPARAARPYGGARGTGKDAPARSARHADADGGGRGHAGGVYGDRDGGRPHDEPRHLPAARCRPRSRDSCLSRKAARAPDEPDADADAGYGRRPSDALRTLLPQVGHSIAPGHPRSDARARARASILAPAVSAVS